ncbi:MAG: hypothetical protein BWZ10_01072 [candidate division BRC1 bacterium ADurb.BinA364]|nr:MAG: hypothetical protein BWZ10_01072 [candidate division BRC1 bacterium ADurb.BinA364]
MGQGAGRERRSARRRLAPGGSWRRRFGFVRPVQNDRQRGNEPFRSHRRRAAQWRAGEGLHGLRWLESRQFAGRKTVGAGPGGGQGLRRTAQAIEKNDRAGLPVSARKHPRQFGAPGAACAGDGRTGRGLPRALCQGQGGDGRARFPRSGTHGADPVARRNRRTERDRARMPRALPPCGDRRIPGCQSTAGRDLFPGGERTLAQPLHGRRRQAMYLQFPPGGAGDFP